MSENETHETNDMMALLKRMQQQLAFLEKKMDTLIQQTQQKPFDRGPRNFSRPFRPFGNRPGQGQGQGYRGGQGQANDRPREGNFAPKKKPFFGGHGGRRPER